MTDIEIMNKQYEAIYENQDVDAALDILVIALEKNFPDLGKKVYISGDEKTNFKKRMKFGIYIELLKAEAIT